MAALEAIPQLSQAQALLVELDGEQGVQPAGYTEPQPTPADNQ
jgi:hypothetical protein